MQTRFKKNAKIFDIVITAVAGMVSVGVMLYSIGLLRNGNKTSKIIIIFKTDYGKID